MLPYANVVVTSGTFWVIDKLHWAVNITLWSAVSLVSCTVIVDAAPVLLLQWRLRLL